MPCSLQSDYAIPNPILLKFAEIISCLKVRLTLQTACALLMRWSCQEIAANLKKAQARTQAGQVHARARGSRHEHKACQSGRPMAPRRRSWPKSSG